MLYTVTVQPVTRPRSTVQLLQQRCMARRRHLADHGGVAEAGGGLRQQAVLLPPLAPPVRWRQQRHTETSARLLL